MASKNSNNKKEVEWNFSPSLESTGHVKLKKQYDLYIGGKWEKPESGTYFSTVNPANKKKLAEIAHANA